MFGMVVKAKKRRPDGKGRPRIGSLSELLTVNEAARFLGVSASTLRNWDRQGKLRPLRHPMNRYRLYTEESLQRLLTGLSEQGAG